MIKVAKPPNIYLSNIRIKTPKVSNMGMHCIQINPLTHILHKLELIK